jgi:hypothetical protein
MPEPAQHVARTVDSRFRVYIYRNQTAELCDEHGRVLVERRPAETSATQLTMPEPTWPDVGLP